MPQDRAVCLYTRLSRSPHKYWRCWRRSLTNDHDALPTDAPARFSRVRLPTSCQGCGTPRPNPPSLLWHTRDGTHPRAPHRPLEPRRMYPIRARDAAGRHLKSPLIAAALTPPRMVSRSGSSGVTLIGRSAGGCRGREGLGLERQRHGPTPPVTRLLADIPADELRRVLEALVH
jgi:hypothetical protein